MGKVIDIITMCEVSTIDQARSVMENSGWVEGSDFSIKDSAITINNKIAYSKIRKVLKETNFKLKSTKYPVIVLETK